MASTESTFRPSHDQDHDREREKDDEQDIAPGRRALTRYLSSPHGEGRELPSSISAGLAPTLGDSFHDVRIHDDAKASSMVRSMGAAGFTYGRQIYLTEGASEDTVAHEAAHASQHRGPKPSGPIKFGGESESEDFADRAAASRYVPSMQVNVPVAAPRVRFKGAAGGDADVVAVIAREMGTNKGKAAQMLRNAPGGNRGPIEAAVKKNFSDKDAKELLEKNPSGGKVAPTVANANHAHSETDGKKGQDPG